MKAIPTLLIPLLFLIACSPENAPPAIGLTNPASVYCADQGGDYHLPDSRVIEEWAFYRTVTE